MEKIITHRGEFLSRSDVLHRVELWRIGGAAVAQPKELRFEADEPLVIEWKETAKHEPICSSSATLRLDSPGDRTYTHLYTITPGAVGMDVYRNGALYWTGTLDAEEYEEPYERAEHYTVSLTFGDFGIWQRLKYSTASLRANRNVQTIGELLGFAIERAGLALALDESLTAVASTHPVGGGVAKWLGCSPENFFDEDRKAATLSEAIESLLQPLGLRVVQRVGRLWLYDLHGLHSAPTSPPVVWSADSQTLSVDSVANNVRISFSPYAKNKLLSSDELKFPRPLRKVWSALNVGRDWGMSRDWPYPDTYLFFSEQRFYITSANYFGKGRQVGEYKTYDPAFLLGLADNPNKQYGNNARLCRFLPISEGDEATAYCVKAPQTVTDRPRYGTGVLPKGDAGAIYTTRSIYLPKISNPALYCLRLRVSVLADRALCPIGTPIEKSADKAARDEMDKSFGWAFLSAEVKCSDSLGQNVWYFDNNHTIIREKPTTNELDERTANNRVKRTWRNERTRCLLAYFDKSDPSKRSALGGWRTNRNNIGQPNDATGGLHNNSQTHQYDRENNMPDGELIPYPVDGGWVSVTVFNELRVYPYSASPTASDPPPAALQWFAVKAPDLEIVRSWGDCAAPDVPDVEYRATLHPDAKEELPIETKCGTLPHDVEGEPLCRGLYLDALRNCAIGDRDMMRAGVTDRPEQLFINSLYSQYATRHTKLSGEAYIYDGALAPRTEANQGTARFIVVEERQDLIEDCGDVTVVELTPDIYKAVESEENI